MSEFEKYLKAHEDYFSSQYNIERLEKYRTRMNPKKNSWQRTKEESENEVKFCKEKLSMENKLI